VFVAGSTSSNRSAMYAPVPVTFRSAVTVGDPISVYPAPVAAGNR